MPNRILKESITTSKTIAMLSAEEERLFCRLMVVCDDFGRYHGDISIIKSHCFPRLDALASETVAAWLAVLARPDIGLIRLYESGGDPFLEFVTWRKHQNVRATKSKFPSPPESGCTQRIATADDGSQQIANVPVLVLESRYSNLVTRSSDLDARESAPEPESKNVHAPEVETKAPPDIKPSRPAKDDPVGPHVETHRGTWPQSVVDVFDAYVKHISPDAKLDISAHDAIRKALLFGGAPSERRSIDEIAASFDGYSRDPWRMNPSQPTRRSLGALLKSAQVITAGLELHKQAKSGPNGSRAPPTVAEVLVTRTTEQAREFMKTVARPSFAVENPPMEET